MRSSLCLRPQPRQRRAQQATVEQVALLEHLGHVVRRHAGGLHLADRLVVLGIERLAGRVQHAQAVLAGDLQQLPVGHLQAVPERAGLAAGRGQAGVQAVEDRQQVAEQALVGELAGTVDLAGDPLALVFEVGAFQQRLRLQLLEFAAQRLEFIVLRHGAGRVVHVLDWILHVGSRA